MTKAILIDSVAKTITEVEKGEGIQDIYKHLKCDTFTVVGLGSDTDCYVDDEGLCKTPYIDDDGIKHNMNGFTFKNMGNVLIGNGLIMGTNEEGESIDSPVSIEQVKEVVTFIEYDNPENRPQPQMGFISF